jgi:hypothetical protein
MASRDGQAPGQRLREGTRTRGLVPDQTTSDQERSYPYASETELDTLGLARDKTACCA